MIFLRISRYICFMLLTSIVGISPSSYTASLQQRTSYARDKNIRKTINIFDTHGDNVDFVALKNEITKLYSGVRYENAEMRARLLAMPLIVWMFLMLWLDAEIEERIEKRKSDARRAVIAASDEADIVIKETDNINKLLAAASKAIITTTVAGFIVYLGCSMKWLRVLNAKDLNKYKDERFSVYVNLSCLEAQAYRENKNFYGLLYEQENMSIRASNAPLALSAECLDVALKIAVLGKEKYIEDFLETFSNRK